VNLYGGHHIGFHSNHEMTFNPIMLFAGDAVLVIGRDFASLNSGIARSDFGGILQLCLRTRQAVPDADVQLLRDLTPRSAGSP
jgi:hypothetical protein